MNGARYPYASGDYLAIRPNYSYSDCSGSDFPAVWLAVRSEARMALSNPGGPQDPSVAVTPPDPDGIDIGTLLEHVVQADADGELDRLVQRFEAGKRLYDVYRGPDRRGDTTTGFREMTRYVRFGEILATAYRRRRALPLLNALLKLCDLLGAHAGEVPAAWRDRAVKVFDQEKRFVSELAHSRGLPWPE